LYTLWIPGEEHLHEVYSDFLKVLSFRLRKNAETISHSKISHKALIDNLRCILCLLNFEVVWVAELTTHYVFRVFARLCRLQPPTQNFLFIALSEFLVNFRIHTYIIITFLTYSNSSDVVTQPYSNVPKSISIVPRSISIVPKLIRQNQIHTELIPNSYLVYRTSTEFVFILPN